MLETALAVAAVLAMLGGAAAAELDAWVWLRAGSALCALGLGVGVPTGLVYHVLLHRALARDGALPPRWWLRPTALHDRLPPDARPRVLRWCAAGAAGFGATALGCAVLTVGVMRLL